MTSTIIFKDRKDAGAQLAKILTAYKGTNTIVLGLPRGGVVVAHEVARTLDLPLDIIVTRKIGAYNNEEYAIGAIDIDGEGVWNEFEKNTADKMWLAQTIEKEKIEAMRRALHYRGKRAPLDLRGKTALIIDDGIATGMTMKSAIRYAKKIKAEKVVVAIPTASPSVVDDLEQDTTVHALETPELFFAVGQFYEDFPQVSDEEVIEILSKNTQG